MLVNKGQNKGPVYSAKGRENKGSFSKSLFTFFFFSVVFQSRRNSEVSSSFYMSPDRDSFRAPATDALLAAYATNGGGPTKRS